MTSSPPCEGKFPSSHFFCLKKDAWVFVVRMGTYSGELPLGLFRASLHNFICHLSKGMKIGQICFSLRKFLAISSAIQKIVAIAVAMPWCT